MRDRSGAIGSLRALGPYLKRHGGVIILSLVMLGATELLAMFSTNVLRDAIDSLGAEVVGWTITTYALVLFGLVLAQGIMRFISRYYMGYASLFIEYEIRNDFFSHLLLMEPGYFVKQNVGDLISRAINDLNSVRNMLGRTLMFFSSSVFRMPLALVWLFLISWKLTLITLVPFLAMPFIMARMSTNIHTLFESIQEQFAAMSSRVRESFSGVRVIKAYTRETDEIRTFDEMNDDFIQKNQTLIRYEALIFPMFTFIPGISFVLMLWIGGYHVANGSITFGQFTQFQFLLGMLIMPMAAFGFTFSGIQRGATSMGRLNDIIQTEPLIKDPDPRPTNELPIIGDLELRNLTFAYEPDLPVVLNDISIKIPAKSTTAIVGPTGCGKTTLVKLIPRLYQTEPGMILIDGKDVRDYTLKHLRSGIGFVQQESFLFSDSIADNLRFGDPDAGEEDLVKAAEVAHLMPEIDDFPLGFDTEVSEGGLTISGGQRQRTSIARSLLARPNIIILDDAFASVDTYTEETILSNLREYLRDITVILISHRVSTVKDADQIIVLNGGKIEAVGTHEELTARPGFYKDLHEKQLLQQELEAL
ncbi:MAG: ABC transporter ATP-binding protein [Candidatus Poribacteria bacterium]|nr:ABC transporter ATP-binding protein [Candidatus Poribacteria bacterium]